MSNTTVQLDEADLSLLRDAKVDQDRRYTYRPYRGSKLRAERLAKLGLLKEAGHSVMWPHTVYVLSEEGLSALRKAAA